MKNILTKLGIVTALLGTIAFAATGTALAKPRHAASVAEKMPSKYACQSSWYYPGYYCYAQSAYYNSSYDWYPTYYAYDSYSCTAAVWNGWQWIRTPVC